MAVYYSYYIFLMLAVLFYKRNIVIKSPFLSIFNKSKLSTERALFLLIPLAVIIGFRNEYQGVDLHNNLGTGYIYYYKFINEDSIIQIVQNYGSRKYANYEIGFVLLCKLVGFLSNSSTQAILITASFLSIIPMALFIGKQSKNIFLSIILLLSMNFFTTCLYSGIRQGIAIAIVMLSYSYLCESNDYGFVLCVLIAALFHSTAIVSLIALVLYKMKMKKKIAMIGGTLLLIITYLNRYYIYMLLAPLISENINLQETNSVRLFILLCILFLLMNFFNIDRTIEGLINIFWAACFAQAFSSLNHQCGRVAWYFIPVCVITIPNIILQNKCKMGRYYIMLWSVYGVAIIISLYFFFNNSMAMAVPYIPFWK